VSLLRLATWNINSIRQRAGQARRWLERTAPDLLVLQEIKCEAPAFPAADFEALGYRAAVVGQKAYNGVALLARVPFEVTHRITIAGIYAPNGNSGGAAGYAYKLAWMDRLRERAAALAEADTPFAIAGDFNVCPTDEDCAPGALGPTDALVRPESRARFRALLWLGLTDALRAMVPSGPVYTFWDYQAGAWPRDLGLRIDHVLLSPTLAERLLAAEPDRRERGAEQPSDHVPLTVDLA